MIINIKIDTEKQIIAPSSDSDADTLVHWLLEEMPSAFGTYYGKVAAKFQPDNEELVINNTALFPEKALEAFVER